MSDEDNSISLPEVRKAIMQRGEAERERLTGEPDLAGERVGSLADAAAAAVDPVVQSWSEHAMSKHAHAIETMGVDNAYQYDPDFRADVDAAREMRDVMAEGARKAYAEREKEEFARLRPQSQSRDGKQLDPQHQFSQDAIDYLREVKKLTPDEAFAAYNFGGLGRASEQAKLFDASNAWARDRRELQSLNAKYHLNGSVTLKEAVRRETLLKRLGKS